MLAGFDRPDRPWHMLIVRQRYIDRVNLWVGQQSLIRAMPPKNTQTLSDGARLVGRARRDSGNSREPAALHGRNHFFDADASRAEDAEADHEWRVASGEW